MYRKIFCSGLFLLVMLIIGTLTACGVSGQQRGKISDASETSSYESVDGTQTKQGRYDWNW